MKNWHIKKRNYCTSLAEVALPVLVMLIMVGIRSAVARQDQEATHYLDEALILDPTASAALLASVDDPIEVSNVLNMEQMAVKLIRRGHVIAISPRRAPFFDPSDSSSFSATLEALIEAARNRYGLTDTRSSYIMGFDDLAAMDDYVTASNYPDNGFLEAGIGFKTDSVTASGGTGYTIRMNQTGDFIRGFNQQIPNTIQAEDVNLLSIKPRTEFARTLYFSGFFALQDYIDAWVLGQIGGDPSLTEKTIIPFPTPDFTDDDFAAFTAGIIPLFWALGFVWPVTRMVKAFVEEKEQRIKEGMKIVGLFSSAHFSSWFACYAIIAFVYSILIVVVSTSVFPFSDKGIIFFFFFFYGLVLIAFSWAIASLFNKASLGSTMGALIFLGAFFGFFGIDQFSATNSDKLAACLSAPICFGFGIQTIVEFESVSQGVTNENFSTQTSNFAMSQAFGMLIADFFLYLLIALYFERVIPSEWGSHLPPWFCFLSSWWCGNSKPQEMAQREFGDFYEPTDGREEVGVSIINLYKRFDTQAEDEAAVKKINIDMYKGQILALLGHNGAGKTTAISMLTGMISPTSGDALIFGRSIVTDMNHIRTDLGMCPQHNILWDYLTVLEHLYCYGRLKGIRPFSKLKQMAEDLVMEVGLTEKRNVISKNLSGGMKRKLSVAIALIGDSRTVFLDEPTSGMDPYSRRSTWDMLKKGKSGRVLILTTHFMDEADYLGDRIAIMHKGEVVACGTSLFLKNRYGVGYTLTITKKENADTKAIEECVSKHVPKAKSLSQVAGESSFQLPKEDVTHFANLFDVLDKNLDDFGIDSYVISMTTMEEVFIRVGHGAEPHDGKKRSQRKQTEREPEEDEKFTKENTSIIAVKKRAYVPYWEYVWVLLLKRWHSSKRSPNVWLWQLVYPTLIIVAGVGLLKLGVSIWRQDIDLNTNVFNAPNRVPIGEGAFALLSTIDSSSSLLFNASTPAGNDLIQEENCIFLQEQPRNDLNLSRYLLCTWDAFKETRYGAYGTVNSSVVQTIFYNATATYGSAIYLNLLNKAKVRSAGTSTANLDATLSAWPRTSEQQALSSSFVALIAAIGYAFMPAAVARVIVQERELNSKHLQVISGVPLVVYWTANFLWDFTLILPAGLLSIAWFDAYDIEQLEQEAGGVLVLAVLLYSASVVMFTYVISFLFSNEALAQNVSLLLYIMLGGILLVTSIILDFIESTQDVNRDLKFMYRLFPSYCLGEVIINLLSRDSTFIWGSQRDVWDIEISGYPMIFMASLFFGYMLILAAIELVLSSPFLYSWVFSSEDMENPIRPELDEEVLMEKTRVQQGKPFNAEHKEDAISLQGLRKVYGGQKIAVEDMWFGIPKGQCFGFLGINGAGKTTTLKMVTGDVIPTKGTAVLNGLDVLTQQREVRKFMGYCPQFDALLPMMTGRETLTMFASFKGVEPSVMGDYVEKMLKRLTLTPYADKPCRGYSGGNKRKLSVGIALIGGPPVVFLDEPSTGMDPVSRRFMWDLISGTLADRSVVLTTHSMEECEALCSRIGIMVSGRLQCIGSIPHLKKRFASGYQVSVKVKPDMVQEFQTWILGEFPDAKILENQQTNMTYQVAHEAKSALGTIFRKLENSREKVGILEYSVSETSLEQIFIKFARKQSEETGPVAGFADDDAKKLVPGTTPKAFTKLEEDKSAARIATEDEQVRSAEEIKSGGDIEMATV